MASRATGAPFFARNKPGFGTFKGVAQFNLAQPAEVAVWGVFEMLAIAIVLFVLWALGFFAFHVAGGLIHLLLVIALVVFVVNLVRGRRAI